MFENFSTIYIMEEDTQELDFSRSTTAGSNDLVAHRPTRVDCYTQVDFYETKFVWKLDNFLYLRYLAREKGLPQTDNTQALESCCLSDNDSSGKWYLKLRPYEHGESEHLEEDQGNVSIFLRGLVEKDTYASCYICLLDHKNDEFPGSRRAMQPHKFTKDGVGRGFGNFIKGSDDTIKRHLVNGDLFVKAVVRVFRKLYTGAAVQEEKKHSITKDIIRFAADPNANDVTINCNGTLFPASKFILCARSSVFYAMLNGSFKEGNMKNICIVDVSPETMKHFIKCCCTDSCDLLDDDYFNLEGTINLARAADKYNFKGLIERCADKLIKNINDTSIVQILRLAHECNFQGLYNIARRHLNSMTANQLWELILPDKFEDETTILNSQSQHNEEKLMV